MQKFAVYYVIENALRLFSCVVVPVNRSAEYDRKRSCVQQVQYYNISRKLIVSNFDDVTLVHRKILINKFDFQSRTKQ